MQVTLTYNFLVCTQRNNKAVRKREIKGIRKKESGKNKRESKKRKKLPIANLTLLI